MKWILTISFLLAIRSMFAQQDPLDVQKYTLDLNLYYCYAPPYLRNFSASEIIDLKLNMPSQQVKLNAVNNSLEVNSVGLAGISFTHQQDTLTITLDQQYAAGQLFSILIHYRHKNVNDSAFMTGEGFAFTDAEPERARRWFPCNDHPWDKALVDISATTPGNVKLGSNGSLVDSVKTGDTIRYHWVSVHPMSTYLVAVSSRANWNLDILWWNKPSNPNDSIPVRFYWNQHDSVPLLRNIESESMRMMDYYSGYFGEYPFEKNGWCSLDNDLFLAGGMENQTLTSLCEGCWTEDIVSHELVHQWFGDMITCENWSEIWLNEGFATWGAAFWLEHDQGYPVYIGQITGLANYYKQDPGGPIKDPSWAVSTPPMAELFNFRITYAKSACILHQLRYLLGDSMFFAVLKDYSLDTNYRFKTVETRDFNDVVNRVSGRNYDWYFDNWIYYPGHPVYRNTYNITEGQGSWTVRYNTRQEQGHFFPMEQEIRIGFSDFSDTTFRIMNDVNLQDFTWTFNRQPVDLMFDPYGDIVLKEGSTVIGIAEHGARSGLFVLGQNVPNPATGKTTIGFSILKTCHIRMEILDLTGSVLTVPVLGEHLPGAYSAEVDCSVFPAGLYFCRMTAGGESQVRKMVVSDN